MKVTEVFDGLEKDLRQDLATARANSNTFQENLGKAQAQIKVLEKEASSGTKILDVMQLNFDSTTNKLKTQQKELNAARAHITALEATVEVSNSAKRNNR